MSGYNSRKIYDECYNYEFINQQVNPCKYNLLPSFGENISKCTALNGPRANKNRSTGELGDSNYSYRTDIESQLFNLDVPDSRCITANTIKDKNERLNKLIKETKVNYLLCDKNQDTMYSRLDIPVNDYRSININRYEYPIVDPKEYVYYGVPNTKQINNERFGVNTQLEAKDKINKPDFNPLSKLTK